MTQRMPSWPQVAVRRALFAIAALAGALVVTAVSAPPPAHAADISVNQCNNIGPSAEGATTAMTCTVTVVNTISGATRGSTVTVTRDCMLGPCPPGNGTFTTTSADIVTSVVQCNGSANDAAHPIVCNVSITNNISADTPGAEPLSAATSNQCVGSGGGGGGTVNCVPFPATTTSATVTQCNGSANGGGGTVACTVDSLSQVSAALPVTVNQCNGTGNPGGSTVTCRTSIATNITAVAAAATPTATTAPPVTTAASTTAGPTPTASTPVASTPVATAPAASTVAAPTTAATSLAPDASASGSTAADDTTVDATPADGIADTGVGGEIVVEDDAGSDTDDMTEEAQIAQVPRGGVDTGGGRVPDRGGVSPWLVAGALMLMTAVAAGVVRRRKTS